MTADTLLGTLDRITYQDERSGFLVGRLIPEKATAAVTIRGVLGNVKPGESLKLWGSWEQHPQYGQQFRVESHLVTQPKTLEGMERYLANTLPGIGPQLAKRIVKNFGERTFEILDEQPELLLEVAKFPKKALPHVKAEWAAHRAVRDIMVYLNQLGVSPLFADRIFAAYGIGAVELVKENPYRLALEIRGIGFRSADLIAAKLGIARDSPHRVDAGLLHVLDEMQLDGHTGCPDALLVRRAAELLEQPPEAMEAGIERLLADGLLRPLLPLLPGAAADDAAADAGAPDREVDGEAPPGKRLLFRRLMFKLEEEIAERLGTILAAEPLTRLANLPEIVAAMERHTGLYLAPEQRAAIEAALEHKVLVITGGPGTGKTTIVRFILGLVSGAIPAVALAAPTGKAAKRLTEATGRPGFTLHRLLEAGPRGFGRDRHRPLELELVIVDESSMVDTALFHALLVALPDHARLVLVGDVDQLPSVGPGRVLSDLIESGKLPVVRLEHIFRQSETSLITRNAHAIRRGQMPKLVRQEGAELLDFYFLPESDPQRIVDKIRTLVAERIPERFGFDPKVDIQVMTPMHRGLTGVQNLNRMLQDTLNPSGAELTFGELRFRVGDRQRIPGGRVAPDDPARHHAAAQPALHRAHAGQEARRHRGHGAGGRDGGAQREARRALHGLAAPAAGAGCPGRETAVAQCGRPARPLSRSASAKSPKYRPFRQRHRAGRRCVPQGVRLPPEPLFGAMGGYAHLRTGRSARRR
jgi:exodeoxyribonuclease V alpha subunit